ncbi:MAG: hypothetical protein QXZ09_05735 [Candidatus Methanomethylicaceae archaeon]
MKVTHERLAADLLEAWKALAAAHRRSALLYPGSDNPGVILSLMNDVWRVREQVLADMPVFYLPEQSDEAKAAS